MPNIILIGFMGSGKTSVGKKLADILGMKFTDLDSEIVKRAGMPINEIFDTYGEKRFRELESETLRSFVSIEGNVIATGGGIITVPSNLETLKNTGKIIYLKNSFETSRLRVEGKGDRPLFRDTAKAYELFEKRAGLYEAASDIIIETDDLNVAQVAEKAAKLAGEA